MQLYLYGLCYNHKTLCIVSRVLCLLLSSSLSPCRIVQVNVKQAPLPFLLAAEAGDCCAAGFLFLLLLLLWASDPESCCCCRPGYGGRSSLARSQGDFCSSCRGFLIVTVSCEASVPAGASAGRGWARPGTEHTVKTPYYCGTVTVRISTPTNFDFVNYRLLCQWMTTI